MNYYLMVLLEVRPKNVIRESLTWRRSNLSVEHLFAARPDHSSICLTHDCYTRPRLEEKYERLATYWKNTGFERAEPLGYSNCFYLVVPDSDLSGHELLVLYSGPLSKIYSASEIDKLLLNIRDGEGAHHRGKLFSSTLVFGGREL